MTGWKLVFSISLCALLLCLGMALFVERAESAKPRPQKQGSSEDGDTGSSSALSSSGRFSKDGQGIIKDKQTGLQWYMGPESNTTWSQAQSWVQSQSVGGGGWRMPTRSELAGLSAKQSDGCYLESIFSYKDRCICVWSGEIRDSSSAWAFYFHSGKETWHFREGILSLRAFAVRSR